jgi:hypothetical protein
MGDSGKGSGSSVDGSATTAPLSNRAALAAVAQIPSQAVEPLGGQHVPVEILGLVSEYLTNSDAANMALADRQFHAGVSLGDPAWRARQDQRAREKLIESTNRLFIDFHEPNEYATRLLGQALQKGDRELAATCEQVIEFTINVRKYHYLCSEGLLLMANDLCKKALKWMTRRARVTNSDDWTIVAKLQSLIKERQG